MAVKVTVNKDACIGCGLCVGSYPETFEFDDEGKAAVIGEIDEAAADEAIAAADEAISNCPVSAIEK